MSPMPKRREPMSSGILRGPHREFPAHRQWVRGHDCSVPGCTNRDIEAAHYDGPVPMEDMGGTGLKRHDKWVFPLCRSHHTMGPDSYHFLGSDQFDARHKISTRDIAMHMQRTSPHRVKWSV